MPKAKKPTPKELYWARKQKEEQERAALLPPGLVNHGNTCFMNSVLQGLFATELLEDLVKFRVGRDLSVKLPSSHRSPLLVNGRDPEDVRKAKVSQMPVGHIFIHTLERAWRMRDNKERSNMSPRELLNRLGQKYDQYLDFRQQDAHEFFLHLLDCMRMEEFDIIKQRQPRPPHKSKRRRIGAAESDGNTSEEPTTIPEQDRLMSFIDMLWSGKFTSVIICETCKHVSHTYEEFDDLSLSISHDESKERKRDRLRSFAAKFMPPGRSRDQDRPRPLSQPPSPALRPITIELLENESVEARRRSFESTSTPDISEPKMAADTEKRKSEMLSNFTEIIANRDDVVGAMPSANSRSKKGDVSFTKLGKRISVGMRWDLKGIKAEKDEKNAPSNTDRVEFDNESGEASKRNSRSSSPVPSSLAKKSSPFKAKRTLNGSIKYNLDAAHKATYLNRLFRDASSQSSNSFAALRMANPNGISASVPWTKISPTQSVEDCLRRFTSVEELDGDNMFGCRNCWKIANGQTSSVRQVKSSEDSEDEDSSDSDYQQEKDERVSSPPGLNHLQSFSTPSPSPDIKEHILRQPSLSSGASSVEAAKPTESVSDLDMEHSTRTVSIPTIAMNLASPDASRPERLPDQMKSPVVPTTAYLRLPSQSHNLSVPRDQVTSPSSDESERDETSGISDGDVSTAGTSRDAVSRRNIQPSIPRSKQVVYRRAFKRYLIAQPPPLLVIHLKRFQQVSKSVTLFGNLKKLDDYVSFPEYLDIQPFLAPKKEDYGLGKGHLKGKVAEKGNRQEDLPCVYRLYAVVVHIGNMLGGHYVAYTALPQAPYIAEKSEHNAGTGPMKESSNERDSQKRQWCFISDSIVKLVTLEEVLKAKAYLCMYERVK